jgi:hypothetical protein
MKFGTMVAVAALVLGLSGQAFAGEDHGGKPGEQAKALASTAVAVTIQAGEVEGNRASGNASNNYIGSTNGTGLFNVQQNGGANSIQQDANTLAAILNCACSNGNTNTTAVALGLQIAEVEHNKSQGAFNTVSGGGDKKEDYRGHTTTSSYVVSSNNYIGNVGGTGLMNISQNTGNNSMQQSANTVAAIVGK